MIQLDPNENLKWNHFFFRYKMMSEKTFPIKNKNVFLAARTKTVPFVLRQSVCSDHCCFRNIISSVPYC